MHSKKIFSVAAGLLLVLYLMAGCGAASAKSATPEEMHSTAYAADGAGEMQTENTAAAQDTGGTTALSPSQMAGANSNRKIIYNATLDMEALDFDAVCAAVAAAVKQAGGYLSYTDLTEPTGAQSTRYATYECRVPVEAYDSFLQAMGDAGNVVSQSATAQDITSEYVDVEARLASLRVQEERLMQMMEKAGDLETLLAIQNQLTEVQYQLESYTAQQRTYDDSIAYCTVTVSIREVKQATPTTDAFGARIVAAFLRGWQGFGAACQNAALWVAEALPGLVALAIVVLAVCLALRAGRKRKMRRNAQQTADAARAAPAAPAAEQPLE